MDFAGKVALVSGGGNGIDRATSVALARQCAKIWCAAWVRFGPGADIVVLTGRGSPLQSSCA
jgi:NAD(P)-dependent dehydrogenase (short-subunit alcohol dehydrogenase family)